jgi:hypothetical protein
MNTRHADRHGLVWPVILVGAGVVLLLNNMGILPWGVWQTLFSLWPVLLIAAGLDLLFGRRSTWGALLAACLVLVVLVGAVYIGLTQSQATGAYRTETLSQPLNSAKDAVVDLDYGVAALSIGPLSEATGNLIEGAVQLAPGERITTDYHKSGDTATYELKSLGVWKPTAGNLAGVWPSDKNWTLSIARDIPIRLRINSGVGRSKLDLEQLSIPELTVEGGVGQVDLTVPRRGQSKITVDGGVGEVIIRVLPSTAARIQIDGGLGGATVDGSFQHSGKTYTTPGFASATDRVEVLVKGGVGKVTVTQSPAE